MTRAYSISLKQQLVARLTGVNAVSAAQLARETGIRQQNLSRWLCEARNRPLGTQDDGCIPAWTVEQKARIIAQAADLTEAELTAYLQREAVKLGEFRGWRRALKEAGEESVSIAKRICKLERELIRKERALAEVATLWVLRETIESQPREEDCIDEGDQEAEELYSNLTDSIFVDAPRPPQSIPSKSQGNCCAATSP